MNKDSRILIVGHDDIIERSLHQLFLSQGYKNVFSSSQLALNTAIQNSVYHFFQENRPEYIFLSSTRSGGIEANQKYAAEFLYHNLESQNNIIHSAYKFGAKKLLFFSSSCVYPKECPQPIKEEYLLTGTLEPTNEPYAIAKIAGIKMCQAYRKQYGFNAIVAVPATIYGPLSDVNIETAHVMGALIGKFAKAVAENQKSVAVWGSGNPRREFIYVDDFLQASLTLMKQYQEGGIIHIGSGEDIAINQLAEIIKDVSGFTGQIVFDKSKPDGVMRKLLDNARLVQLGWQPQVGLKEGIAQTYQWFQKSYQQA